MKTSVRFNGFTFLGPLAKRRDETEERRPIREDEAKGERLEQSDEAGRHNVTKCYVIEGQRTEAVATFLSPATFFFAIIHFYALVAQLDSEDRSELRR